jgi:hypothetical protein
VCLSCLLCLPEFLLYSYMSVTREFVTERILCFWREFFAKQPAKWTGVFGVLVQRDNEEDRLPHAIRSVVASRSWGPGLIRKGCDVHHTTHTLVQAFEFTPLRTKFPLVSSHWNSCLRLGRTAARILSTPHARKWLRSRNPLSYSCFRVLSYNASPLSSWKATCCSSQRAI